jgi:hypothetical protein
VNTNATEDHRQNRHPNEGHEPWCDRAAHARAAAAAIDPVPCEGHERVITLSGVEYGSYWTLREGRAEPVLFTEWPGLRVAELSPHEARGWFDVLLHFDPSRDVDQVTAMLGEALDEYEGSDAWRDRL